MHLQTYFERRYSLQHTVGNCHSSTKYCSGMLSPWGQRGLEAKIFGLGLCLVVSSLVLVLVQCWPRSHEGCPRGLVVSDQNHVIYVTFFSDTLLEELVFLKCNDCHPASALILLWWVWFLGVDKFYVGAQAFIRWFMRPSKYCPSGETFHTPARLLRVDVVRIIWANGRSLWRRHRELSVCLSVCLSFWL